MVGLIHRLARTGKLTLNRCPDFRRQVIHRLFYGLKPDLACRTTGHDNLDTSSRYPSQLFDLANAAI